VNGLNVLGYHIVNLLIHIINAMLVYFIIKATFNTDLFRVSADKDRVSQSNFITMASALLFISHPIHTQAVTYLSQRFTSLATCFYLLSLLFYIYARLSSSGFGRVAAYTAALLSAVAAMLTKEFTFTLPFVIAIYEMIFFKGSVRDRLKVLSPFVITLAIIPVLVFGKQGTMSTLLGTMKTITAADATNIHMTDYLLTQFRVIILYLRLLFFPINQNVDHDITVFHSFFSFPVVLSFIALLALFSLGIYLFRVADRTKEYPELKLASFGIFWFFITISIESSIIPMGELAAEYRIYLPSIGMLMAVLSLCLFLTKKYSRVEAKQLAFLYGMCALLVATLSISTYVRNSVYGSQIALWEDAARKSPALVRPHQNLGVYYGAQGRLEDAKQELITARSLKPTSTQLRINLCMTYAELGAYDDAIRECVTAISLAPGNAIAHNNLGGVYLAQGRMPEAIREYQVAVGIMPDYADAHNNLGIALCQIGQIDLAINEFNRSLQFNPQNVNFRNNLEACIGKAKIQMK
jgi:Flp pilus assembly protein TadD